jgi:PAS domain S-box-containing protein
MLGVARQQGLRSFDASCAQDATLRTRPRCDTVSDNALDYSCRNEAKMPQQITPSKSLAYDALGVRSRLTKRRYLEEPFPIGVRQQRPGNRQKLIMNDSPEARLKINLDAIPAQTWYATSAGALTFVNQRTAEYLGLPEDHPLRFGVDTGAGWDSHLKLLHPEDHEQTRKIWSECLATGWAGQLNFRVRDAQGSYRWFISCAEPVRDKNGELLYWIGVNLDVEERKQAEFYLAEGQRLAHTGSWAFDAEGFKHWSPELFQIHGLKPDSQPPSAAEYLALVHPDDRQSVRAAMQTMLPGAGCFDFTKRIVRPDGGIRFVRCVGTPATRGNGFVGTGIDVTDHETLTLELRQRVAEVGHAQKQLAEQERELRQALDLTPLLVAVLGPERERIYANGIALEYMGTTLDTWRQRSVGFETHPDDVERMAAAAREGRDIGADYEIEARIRRADGAYRWLLARYKALRNEEGRAIRWYVACTDIEDRKKSEESLRAENVALREEIDKTSMFEEIIGSSPALAAVLARVSKVATSDSTVLITGETGTGKELVARAIHRRSGRAARPFVAVNCAAIPRDLIASELFGHERGAFTGALQRRTGRFELANGGTIFLDEIAELTPEMQATLLRVLQEREIERVGGTGPIPVDVRVIAATNRDLMQAIANQTFREDLLYRLNVFPIEMPSLRDRKQDIPVLVEYFIHRYATKANKNFARVSKQALSKLQSYPWPGNVRELQNVIERSVIVCEGEEFGVDGSWLCAGRKVGSAGALSSKLTAYEKTLIEDALLASDGQVFGPNGAAARLRLPRTTLESRIRALRINKSRFRTRPTSSNR